MLKTWDMRVRKWWFNRNLLKVKNRTGNKCRFTSQYGLKNSWTEIRKILGTTPKSHQKQIIASGYQSFRLRYRFMVNDNLPSRLTYQTIPFTSKVTVLCNRFLITTNKLACHRTHKPFKLVRFMTWGGGKKEGYWVFSPFGTKPVEKPPL